MKTISNKATNAILAAAAVALTVLCFASIAAPLRFDCAKAEREKAVKQRLMLIRTAEERWLKAEGRYCASLDTLVARGYMADSLRYIPHSGGQVFELQTSVVVSPTGKAQPTMVCGARYETYLDGLDDNSIAEATASATAAGAYPGLCIGNLTTPDGNAPNWR